ncbi:TAF5-like RNA polymerase II p300/CBP-associated factor-associated factor 65 kDa subunit 5L isoform X1 [Parasteatoda tepidariorum]|uniref:TAF5-like RNA polymerase II p300/CBP-associated factor-associated factor 65 kDa subunit 5L isoform X1 n=1 Tax=Parasteatoda tepidariorum TaxID=114398 RepID=UPI001C7181A3|nr:TAF5-like RNA polymerase II p300/CBP-associated factor-associated factor 65 kDa subunit 5L isoform X1 [Parasteatoda tepidariorum]
MAVNVTSAKQWLKIPLNYSSANDEFKNFIKLIKTSPESIKSELSNYLYPFFVYIYMTLLQNNKVDEGQQFLLTYSPLFSNAAGYASVLKALQDFRHFHEFENHTYFKQFCESKYIVNSTEECFSKVKSFLEEIKSQILITIVRLHIHNKVNSPQNIQEGKELKSDNIEKSSSYEAEYDVSTVESEIMKFKSVVKSLKGNLCKPISYTYRILTQKKSLCAVDVNASNTLLACGFENSELHLWDLTKDFLKIKSEGKKLVPVKVDSGEFEKFLSCDISVEKVSNMGSNRLLHGHTGSVFGLAITPDSTVLLSCSEDCTARAWNLVDFKNSAVYSGHNHPIWDIAMSPDSAYFATASKDARMWMFEESEPLRIFVGHTGDVECITFHPNSKYIATASTDKTLRLWTTQDARTVRSFVGHEAFISSIVFSPNGKHLASADDNGLVKIWDLSSGLAMKEFKPHIGRILSMSYNRNGTLLATGGCDKYLKVWDALHGTVEGTPDKTVDKNNSEEGSVKLVDTHFIDSKLHCVKFCERNLLVSVSSK